MVEGNCEVMDAIGGYFSLELSLREEFHKTAIRLNTGRNCLEYILRARNYRKVYIPYYTCEVILEPFRKLGIDYEFYHIDMSLELAQDINLKSDEALIYTNYFGLKQKYVEFMAEKIGSQLIVDNTQAFFARHIEGIDTFYTCRKFFGVPDGAYLYTDAQADFELEQDASYERMSALLKRIDTSPEDGYTDFINTERVLSNQPIRRMSQLTKCIMQSIDYSLVTEHRRANYNVLHKELENSNLLHLKLESDAVPMVYPYLPKMKGLRDYLINNKIYIPQYWPNIVDWVGKETFEYKLMQCLLPLPIDQRYGKTGMERIISSVSDESRY